MHEEDPEAKSQHGHGTKNARFAKNRCAGFVHGSPTGAANDGVHDEQSYGCGVVVPSWSGFLGTSVSCARNELSAGTKGRLSRASAMTGALSNSSTGCGFS